MTIDYRAHTLLLRPATPRPSPTEHPSGVIVLDFTYDGVSTDLGWGVPCVEGTIEGKKVHCLIDTGWNLPAGVSPAVFATLSPTKKRLAGPVNFVFGSSTVHMIPDVRMDLGDLHITEPVLESPLLGMGKQIPEGFKSDVLLGASALQSFKLTIDYPARQIRLAAYR